MSLLVYDLLGFTSLFVREFMSSRNHEFISSTTPKLKYTRTQKLNNSSTT